MHTRAHRRRRRATLVLAGTALAFAGSVAALVVASSRGVVVVREGCVVRAADGTVRLSVEQAANAATIAGVGVRDGMDERAVTIALATAIQESKLTNLDHGDRDSLGLFQQRPSQGWGRPAQIRDPVYASDRFYAALRKVPNYQRLSVTAAAQRVQRSAYGSAYQDHEADGRALAAAFTGRMPAAVSCSVRPPSVEPQPVGPEGLTSRAAALREQLERTFGRQSLGGFAPGGVRSGHTEGSMHYEGRAIDVSFPSGKAAARREGWAVAHWLVAHADALGVATVIYDDRIWSARRSGEDWRRYVPPSGDPKDPTLRHLDHVHVDVLG